MKRMTPIHTKDDGASADLDRSIFRAIYSRLVYLKRGCSKVHKGADTFEQVTKRYDAEIERRIKKWILDSRPCYGKVPDFAGRSEDSPHISSAFCDGLEFSSVDFALTEPTTIHHDTSHSTIEIASATVSRKELNRNRWRGRLPALGPADPTKATDATAVTAASHANMQVQLPASTATSRSVPMYPPDSRGGRVIWMRRSTASSPVVHQRG